MVVGVAAVALFALRWGLTALLAKGAYDAVKAGVDEQEVVDKAKRFQQLVNRGEVSEEEAAQHIAAGAAYTNAPKPGFEMHGPLPAFNAGNALGIENPVARNVANYFDPIYWVAAPLAIGKGVKAFKGLRGARAARTGGKMLKALTPETVTESTVENAAKAMQNRRAAALAKRMGMTPPPRPPAVADPGLQGITSPLLRNMQEGGDLGMMAPLPPPPPPSAIYPRDMTRMQGRLTPRPAYESPPRPAGSSFQALLKRPARSFSPSVAPTKGAVRKAVPASREFTKGILKYKVLRNGRVKVTRAATGQHIGTYDDREAADIAMEALHPRVSAAAEVWKNLPKTPAGYEKVGDKYRIFLTETGEEIGTAVDKASAEVIVKKINRPSGGYYVGDKPKSARPKKIQPHAKVGAAPIAGATKVLTGSIGGETYWTDGQMLVKGTPSKTVAKKIPELTSDHGETFEMLVRQARNAKPATIAGYASNSPEGYSGVTKTYRSGLEFDREHPAVVVLRGGGKTAIANAKKFEYMRQQFPSAEIATGSVGDLQVVVLRDGDDVVGVLSQMTTEAGAGASEGQLIRSVVKGVPVGAKVPVAGKAKPAAAETPTKPIAEPKAGGKKPWEMTGAEIDKLYPKAGVKVDGRTVRADIPNTSSIDASTESATVLKGVREIPMSEFSAPPVVNAKTTLLAKAIQKSGEVNPLIVMVDQEGAYILEGSSRYDALKILKAKSIPALVVVDEQALYSYVEAAVKSGKPVPASVLAEYPDLAKLAPSATAVKSGGKAPKSKPKKASAPTKSENKAAIPMKENADIRTIKGVESVEVQSKKVGGKKYVLYNANKIGGGKSAVLELDAESGKVIGSEQYPSMLEAEKAYVKAVAPAKEVKVATKVPKAKPALAKGPDEPFHQQPLPPLEKGATDAETTKVAIAEGVENAERKARRKPRPEKAAKALEESLGPNAKAWGRSANLSDERIEAAWKKGRTRQKRVHDADLDDVQNTAGGGVPPAGTGKLPPSGGKPSKGDAVWGPKDFHVKEKFLNRQRAMHGTVGGEKIGETLLETHEAMHKMEATLNIATDKVYNEAYKQLGLKGMFNRTKRLKFDEQVAHALEGRTKGLPKEAIEAAKKLRKQYDDVFLKMVEEGVLTPNDYVSDYFTHVFGVGEVEGIIPKHFKGVGFHRKGKTGYPLNSRNIIHLYNRAVARKIYLTGRGGAIDRMENLTREIPDDLKVMKAWYERFAKTLRHNPDAYQWEKNTYDAIMKRMPFAWDAKKLAPKIPYEDFMATVRGYQGITKIAYNPGPTIANSLQTFISTFPELGLKATVAGVKKFATAEGRAELRRLGIHLQQNRADAQITVARRFWSRFQEIGFKPFDKIEFMNKGIAYYAGEYAGLKMGLSAVNAQKFARATMYKTQFIYDLIDLPEFMSTPGARTLFQFKTFSANQIALIGEWGKEAIKGNRASQLKVARLLGAMVAIGGPGTLIATAAIRNQLGEDHPAAKLFDGIEKLSVSGITGVDLSRKIDFGYVADPVSNVTGFKPVRRLLGPAVGGVYNVASGLKGLATGNSRKAKNLLRELPGGSSIYRIARATDTAAKGGERTPSGTLKIKMGASEVALQALGLSSMRIKRLRRARRTKNMRHKDYSVKRSQWSTEIIVAIREGDDEAVKVLRAEAGRNGFLFTDKDLVKLRKKAMAEKGTLEKVG